MRYFFFGSLRDQDVLERVIGRPAPLHSLRAARLPGLRLVRVRNETFPTLAPDPGGAVEGEVVEGLGPVDVDRILFFESVEYVSRAVMVELPDGEPMQAQIFAPSERVAHDDEPWDYASWRRDQKAELLRVTDIWMQFYGLASAEEADRLWDEAVAAGRPLKQVVEDLRTGTLARREVGT